VFRSSTSFGQGACIDGRAAVALTPWLDVEGSVAVGRTRLITHITQDPEAADATASERLAVYLFDGGIAAGLERWRRGRIAPYVTMGGGSARQVHEGHTLVSSGATLYAGGGFRYPARDLATRGWSSVSWRTEVRATIVAGDLTPGGGRHVMPVVVTGLSVHP
jgi:hypothetical protein